MMNISVCRKGQFRIYCRFRDTKNGFPEVNLPPRLNDAIHTLEYTFKNRSYINDGIATEADLDKLIQRLRDNLK